MLKSCFYRRRCFAAVLVSSLLVISMTRASSPGQKTVSGNVPAAARMLVPNGVPPASKQLNLAIGLPVHKQDELKQFLADLYDPASTNYRKYLTPEQFTERFGPSQQEYEAIIQ